MGSLYDKLNGSTPAQNRVKPFAPVSSSTPAFTPSSLQTLRQNASSTPQTASSRLDVINRDRERGISLSQGTVDQVLQQRQALSGIPVIGQFLTGTGPQGPSSRLYPEGSVRQSLVEKGIVGFFLEGFQKKLNPTRAEVGEQIFTRYEKLQEIENNPARALELAIQDTISQSPGQAKNVNDLKNPGITLSKEEKEALFWTNTLEDAFAVLDAPVFVGSTKIPKNALLSFLKKTNKVEDIIPRLRMIGISEEVAGDIAPKLAKSSNELEIARLIEDAKAAVTEGAKPSLFSRIQDKIATKITPGRTSRFTEEARQATKIEPGSTPARALIKRTDEVEEGASERFFRSTQGGRSFEEIVPDEVVPAFIRGDLDTFVTKLGDEYQVIEGKTGQQIGDGGRSVSEAVQRAKSEVEALGDERLNEFLSNSPLSPRYTQVVEKLPIEATKSIPSPLPKGVITADKLPAKLGGEKIVDKVTSMPVKKDGRINRKMLARVQEARSFEDFAKRAGLTDEALEATAKSKGFKNARHLYDEYKKSAERVKQYSTSIKEDHKILDTELGDLHKQIKEIGTKSSDEITDDLVQLEAQISMFDELTANMPGRNLVKFISKKEGQFLDFKDPAKAKTPRERARIEERNARILKASESAFEGTRWADVYDDPDVIREAIDEYLEYSKRRKGLQLALKEKRVELRQKKRVQLLEEVILSNRNNAKTALDSLTDDEIFMLDPKRFQEYMVGYLNKREAHRQARIALQATINEKELVKWENARKALKMPSTFEKMTVEQMDELNKYLQNFETGDVFLGPRTIQTLKNTDLSGIATRREAVEKLVQQINKLRDIEGKPHVNTAELMGIQPSELWNYMGGNSLQRQNPLFEVMIHDMYKVDIASGMAVVEAREMVNELFKAARKSRKRGLVARLIPLDRQIFRWLEANDVEKLNLAKTMTAEELKAAQWVQADFAKMRDQLVRGEVLKRGMKDYVTHIRRSFLEAWREGGDYAAGIVDNSKPGAFKRFFSGMKAAGKELFDKYKQDEAVMNILDTKTGSVLPLNKFFKFSMKRTGQLVPSKNVARAYMAYKETFERKRALDSLMPKYQAVVDAITPMKETKAGLVFDDRLNSFFKEFMNTQKGRIANRGFLTPGGKLDWGVRSLTTLVRLLYLGFSIPVGLTSQAGAQSVVFKGLGTAKYQRGIRRLSTNKGRAIAEKYAALVGDKALQPMFNAASTLGERVDTLAYGLFANAGRNANMTYLLGSMSKDEWVKGVIDPDRLAFIKRDIAKQLPISGLGSKSIMGQTAIGGTVKQFKSWAAPQISTTLSHINKLTKRKVPLNSPEGKELFRTAVLTTAIVLGSYEFMQTHKNRKDRNFAEEIAFKAARDALSSIGALDPTIYTSEPAALSFIGKLATALKQVALAEKTKDGELKGLNTLVSAITPSALRQFNEPEKKTTTNKATETGTKLDSLNRLDKLDGLNKLDKLDQLNKLDELDSLDSL